MTYRCRYCERKLFIGRSTCPSCGGFRVREFGGHRGMDPAASMELHSHEFVLRRSVLVTALGAVAAVGVAAALLL